jgi:proton-dependent oligopeptide transporter, POT family
MLADKLLGPRLAVIIGGLLMAAGHLLMTVQNGWAFFTALALLIAGNGFFKPNISTIVGSLYASGNRKRDGGFTIFYMGVNLGAALAPLLCGYIGETYGWHMGFGLATVGMLLGVAVFVAPTIVTQALIMMTACGTACGLVWFHPAGWQAAATNISVAIALLVAGVVAVVALTRGGVPADAGAPPDRARIYNPIAVMSVFFGTVAAIVAFVLLVSGFAPLTKDNRPIALIPNATIESMQKSDSPTVQGLAIVVEECSRPAALVLMLAGFGALGYIGFETFRLDKIGRHRMYVVMILTFFSMLFWSFFEQAGSSVNNFTDRNVDRVFETGKIAADKVGETIRLQPTQEQVGYHNGSQLFTINVLDKLRAEHKPDLDFEIGWTVAEDNLGMGLAKRTQEIPASTFQSVNPIYILMFGLAFTALWSCLAKRGWEPSTTVKFAMGLLQLGLGFGVFWYGAQHANERGMVWLGWLFLGYLLHTSGELCLSPVGLSMIARLSPAHLVSTVMGVWFLATAFSQYLAGIIALFTGVSHGGEGGGSIPPPQDTVHVYGDVFGKIALAALASAVLCFLLAPLLNWWMHPEADVSEQG